MMDFLKYTIHTLIRSVAAGICIGIGGIVYLMQDNPVIGSFLFSIGLLTILIFKFNLFTGMIGYIIENLKNKKYKYIYTLIITFLGNFIGTYIVAQLIKLTRYSNKLIDKCDLIIIPKLNDTWYSLLILGIFCGMLMYIAVDTYKKYNDINKIVSCLIVFMGVMVFILAGFEHCIANMFYFVLSNKIDKSIEITLFVTMGNILGGILIPIIQKIIK